MDPTNIPPHLTRDQAMAGLAALIETLYLEEPFDPDQLYERLIKVGYKHLVISEDYMRTIEVWAAVVVLGAQARRTLKPEQSFGA